MKRFFWIPLLLILLFACTAFADTGELSINGDFTAIAAHGNTVYLLDSRRNLFIVQAGQSFPESPAFILPREADFLLVDQGALYGLETMTGALFRIDTATGAVSDQRRVETDSMLDLRDGHIVYEFSGPSLHDGTLTALWAHTYYNLQAVIQFAPDGTHTIYDLNGDDALLYGDPDGRIIIVSDFCGEVVLAQFSEQDEFTWLRELPIDIWGVAQRGETLYVGAGNYIEQYDSLEAPDGQIAACLPETSVSMGTQSMKILDDNWAALISNGTFYLRRLDVSKNARSLTLPVELYYEPEMNAAFLAEHPNVALRFADWWMENPVTDEEYEQAIANLEADILTCELDYSPWESLRGEGYAADLSASALLQQTVADMYPVFRDACMRGGKAVGLPLACDFAWTLHINKQALLDQTGFAGEQLPKTFLDLPEFVNRWAAQYLEASPDSQPLYSNPAHPFLKVFIERYVSYYDSHHEPVIFDTPLFRAGLALREQLPKLPVSDNMGTGHDLFILDEDWLSANRAPGLLPLPLDAEHPYAIPITLSLLFVNPNSPNMDLAIAYMESAIQSMPPEKQALWMPGDGQPVPNPNYEAMLAEYTQEVDALLAKIPAFAGEEQSWLEGELADLHEEAAEFTEYGRWLVSPDFLQAYGLFSEHMYLYTEDFFDSRYYASEQAFAADRLREHYLDGYLDADELIVGLQRMADMRQATDE